MEDFANWCRLQYLGEPKKKKAMERVREKISLLGQELSNKKTMLIKLVRRKKKKSSLLDAWTSARIWVPKIIVSTYNIYA